MFAYLLFGEATGAVLSSFFDSSVFFTSGEAPGLPGDSTFLSVTVGEATGLATGDATGLGFATGGLFSVAFGSHAPNAATLTAKTVASINDLLIFFYLN